MSGSFSDDMRAGTWIVTGGAGYLGRSLVLRLRALGIRAVAFDNFSTSKRVQEADTLEVELTDGRAVRGNWNRIEGPIAGVFHFAAKALVGESHEIPHVYFENNILSALHIARLCAESQDAPVLIHSSSCAVYGAPDKLPLSEDSPLAPLSPYGATKKMVEEMLEQMSASKGLRVLNLRYFNPVGALEGASHGECHEPETHLIPNAVRSALHGKPFQIFGTDYPTPDGTCLRDYFHIEDLLDAHTTAASYLMKQAKGHNDRFNIGGGTSTSVKQIVQLVETVTGRKIATQTAARRPGDPPRLEASIDHAKRLLKWAPSRTLKAAIASHVEWTRSTGI